MDEDEHKLLESAEKGVTENYLIARNFLKKYFRTIYENEVWNGQRKMIKKSNL